MLLLNFQTFRNCSDSENVRIKLMFEFSIGQKQAQGNYMFWFILGSRNLGFFCLICTILWYRFFWQTNRSMSIVYWYLCFFLLRFQQAAAIYALTQISFEEVSLKFLQAKDTEALKIFLQKKMINLKNNVNVNLICKLEGFEYTVNLSRNFITRNLLNSEEFSCPLS